MSIIVSLIAAVADNNVIGYENRLPWRISDDLKHFKRVTLGKAVIMGRTTYQSLPKPLPKRLSIVLTHNTQITSEHDHVVISHSIDQALAYAKTYSKAHNQGEIVIAGGQHIYQQFWPRVNKLYLTRVKARPVGDAFCPLFDELDESWQLLDQTHWPHSKTNQYSAHLYVYQRNSKES